MEETTPEQKKSNLLPIIGVIALLVIVGGGFAFAKMNSSTPTSSTTTTDDQVKPKDTTAPTEASDVMSAEADTDVKIVKVEAGSFYFKPNVITVKKGQKVKIVMKAVSMMHDFNIDELNVKMPITKDGDTGTVEFTADQVGTFEYYCSVGQHRQMGQVGTLTVE